LDSESKSVVIDKEGDYSTFIPKINSKSKAIVRDKPFDVHLSEDAQRR
jgi:hypothetical protein